MELEGLISKRSRVRDLTACGTGGFNLEKIQSVRLDSLWNWRVKSRNRPSSLKQQVPDDVPGKRYPKRQAKPKCFKDHIVFGLRKHSEKAEEGMF